MMWRRACPGMDAVGLERHPAKFADAAQADDWWQVVKNDPPAQVDVAGCLSEEAESALAELEDGEDSGSAGPPR